MRRGLRVLVLAGFVGGLGVAASLSQLGFALEEDVGLGWLFRLRGTRPAPEEAVVVRFDRDALARLRALAEEGPPQAWPQPLAGCRERHGGLDRLGDASGLDRLPRVVQACLVEELTRRGAAAIAFDISFRRDPAREEGVQALADAIRAHGRVVLLENAVRNWLPAAVERAKPGAAVQTDVVEKPHAALAAAAVATAPFLLPRGSARCTSPGRSTTRCPRRRSSR